MPDNILFYLVFFSQILLFSVYFPRKILGRMRSVLEIYPPSEYPKLYPKPVSYYEKFHRNYEVANHLILGAGVILMFTIGLSGYSLDDEKAELLPWAYFMVQMAPQIVIELSEFVHLKLMRKADLRMARTAELHPRRLYDFVSPNFIGMAVFAYVACIVFDFYINQFDSYWHSDAFERFLLITATNLFFAGIAFWILYGKKLDPYQANKDRLRQIGATLKSMVFVSIGMSMYLMIREGVDEFDLDYLMPSIMSLYCQLIALAALGTMLGALRVENIDFDVYKEDASPT